MTRTRVYCLLITLCFRERVINSTRGTLEEISLQGLQPGTTYTVRVLAHNQQGPGLSSLPASITTQSEVDLPSPPANISARPTSAFSILVRWDPPADQVKKYKLYHRRVSSWDSRALRATEWRQRGALTLSSLNLIIKRERVEGEWGDEQQRSSLLVRIFCCWKEWVKFLLCKVTESTPLDIFADVCHRKEALFVSQPIKWEYFLVEKEKFLSHKCNWNWHEVDKREIPFKRTKFISFFVWTFCCSLPPLLSPPGTHSILQSATTNVTWPCHASDNLSEDFTLSWRKLHHQIVSQPEIKSTKSNQKNKPPTVPRLRHSEVWQPTGVVWQCLLWLCDNLDDLCSLCVWRVAGWNPTNMQ